MGEATDKKRILVVDDNPDIVELITNILKLNGYAVDKAYTGEEALNLLKTEPDLMLLDRNLPDCEGLEVCANIRKDPAYNRMPIIILSALDAVSEKVEGLDVGADDYITKPFYREELVARIQAAMRRKQFMQKDREELESLVEELKNILKERLITTFYQPIFSMSGLDPIGLEMLSRPPTNSRLEDAVTMFDAAQAFGLYLDLETLCWEQGISDWKNQINKGNLFLNCTPQFVESKKLEEDILSRDIINPENIVLELVNYTKGEKQEVFLKQIKKYQNLGVRILIDDFSGVSSSYGLVDEIKPEYIKIDGSLIQKIHIDGLKQNMVKTIVNFCKEREIKAIAKSVQDIDDYKYMFKIGISALQGNLLATAKKEINLNYYLDD